MRERRRGKEEKRKEKEEKLKDGTCLSLDASRDVGKA